MDFFSLPGTKKDFFTTYPNHATRSQSNRGTVLNGDGTALYYQLSRKN